MSKMSECMYDYRYSREEPEVAKKCKECGENIYYGEEAYVVGNNVYCEDCVRKTVIRKEDE